MSDISPCLMTAGEHERLAELVKGKIVLELGCWKGRTTVRMARSARRVWTVDTHRGAKLMGRQDSLSDYFRYLEAEGVRDLVVSVVGEFSEVCNRLARTAFDVVLVDGDHDYESVRRDIALALSALGSFGTLVLHDWGRWDVTDAAARILGQPDEVAESLAIYKYTY